MSCRSMRTPVVDRSGRSAPEDLGAHTYPYADQEWRAPRSITERGARASPSFGWRGRSRDSSADRLRPRSRLAPRRCGRRSGSEKRGNARLRRIVPQALDRSLACRHTELRRDARRSVPSSAPGGPSRDGLAIAPGSRRSDSRARSPNREWTRSVHEAVRRFRFSSPRSDRGRASPCPNRRPRRSHPRTPGRRI